MASQVIFPKGEAMTFHIIAFGEVNDNTANQDLAAITDDRLRIANAHFVLDQDRDLLFAAFVSDDAQRARLVYPKARHLTLPFLSPVVDDLVRSNPMAIADYRDNPLRLPNREEIAVEGTHDNVGSIAAAAILGLAKGPLGPAPAGERYTMRVTSTTAAVALTWTTLVLVVPDTLPNGTYAVVGLRCVAVEGLAARFIFEDQTDRPGCISVEDENQAGWPGFRDSTLGNWGVFTGDRFPNIQVLNVTTTAVHTLYIDFVRIA